MFPAIKLKGVGLRRRQGRVGERESAIRPLLGRECSRERGRTEAPTGESGRERESAIRPLLGRECSREKGRTKAPTGESGRKRSRRFVLCWVENVVEKRVGLRLRQGRVGERVGDSSFVG